MMRYRRLAFLASVFVLTPVVLLIVVGILVLAFQRTATDITFGVLILSFCALLIAATLVLVWVLKREADVSRLQADFLSKVSHDFRTPLTSIRMFVETLRENRSTDQERRERVLSHLSRETERLSTLIDRLLEFARLEAGRMRYEPRDIALEDVVQRVVERFESRLVDGNSQFNLTMEAQLPLIHADPDALSEVLQNLLDNAFKYTADDKRIELDVKRQGKHIVLAVQDNGPGCRARIICAFLSASIAPTIACRARRKVRGWAWRFRATLWSPMAARSALIATTTAARGSL